MALSVFLGSLPKPSQLRFDDVRFNRTSGLPGRHSAALLNKNPSLPGEVSFFFSPEQAQAFHVWWLDTIEKGGYWFSADWRNPWNSGAVVLMTSAPAYAHAGNGSFNVSFRFEMRQDTLPVNLPVLDFTLNWPLLTSGNPGYPSPVGFHPHAPTVGPFGRDVRLLALAPLPAGPNTGGDDRIYVNGVVVWANVPIASAPVPTGLELLDILPAGQVATFQVQNLVNPDCSGHLRVEAVPLTQLPATVEPPRSSVLCCLHMEGTEDGTTFTDSGPLGLAVTNVGGVKTKASAKFYGSTGGSFDGFSYLSITDPALILGASYAIDWSMSATYSSGYVPILAFGSEAPNRMQVMIGPSGGGSMERPRIYIDIYNAGIVAFWEGVPNGPAKYRLQRLNATTFELYINGLSVGVRSFFSGFATGNHGNGGLFMIGGKPSEAKLLGSMDELRVTSGAITASLPIYTTRHDAFPDT